MPPTEPAPFVGPADWQPLPPNQPLGAPSGVEQPVAFVDPTAWQAPAQPVVPRSPAAQGWPDSAQGWPGPPPGPVPQPAPSADLRAALPPPSLPRRVRSKPARPRASQLRWVLIVLIVFLVLLAAYVFVIHPAKG